MNPVEFRRWFLVGIASASFFLSYFSRLAWGIVSVYSTLRPTIVEDSIVFSLFFIGYVIVQLPSGFVSDRVDPRYVIMAALVGLALSSLVSGLGDSMFVEYIASFFMGLSAGWVYPGTVKLISMNFRGKDLPIAMGYYSLAWPLSIVLAGAVLPFISINLGWRWAYYVVFLVSIITSILYLTIKPGMAGNGGRPQRGLVDFSVFRNANALVVSFSGFLFFLSYWIITLYAYKYFLTLGLNDYLAGFAYSLLALAGIPSTIIAGYIIRRLGVKNTLVIFEAAYGILTILLSLPLGAWVITVAAFMGFVRFVITPANSTAVSLIGGERAGSTSGMANFFWQLSGAVAPGIAAYVLLTLNYKYLWLISGIVIIISAIIYQFLLRLN
nr:MFS transporter [Vulcanisaeta thermophila]